MGKLGSLVVCVDVNPETNRYCRPSSYSAFFPSLRIRIRRIRMFFDLLDPDPDPLVRGMDPDPSIIKQKQ
jgi:hypothetical protein